MDLSGQASCPSRIPPGERATGTGTNCRDGWVNQRAGLNTLKKRKISCPFRESNHDFSFFQSVDLSLYRLCCFGSIIRSILSSYHYRRHSQCRKYHFLQHRFNLLFHRKDSCKANDEEEKQERRTQKWL
jgi:hypothetical protein